MSDVDSDRDRLTGMSRSVQSNRNDLNQLTAQVQEFRELRQDYERNKAFTAEAQAALEHREHEHFKEMRADHILQTQICERLDKSVNEIKAECKTLAEKQEQDNNKLREMSSKQYMAAMDHALGLSDNVKKLKTGEG